MATHKHTSGPWGVPDSRRGLISKGSALTGWKGMIAQADVGNYACSIEEGRANAQLIAAAPDMYAVLSKLLAAWESIPDSAQIPDEINDSTMWDEAFAAIDKAESLGV